MAAPGGRGELRTEWLPPPANMESAPDGVTFSTPLSPSAMYSLPLESKATSTGLMLKLVAGAVGVVDGVEPPPPATRVIVAAGLAETGEAGTTSSAAERPSIPVETAIATTAIWCTPCAADGWDFGSISSEREIDFADKAASTVVYCHPDGTKRFSPIDEFARNLSDAKRGRIRVRCRVSSEASSGGHPRHFGR